MSVAISESEGTGADLKIALGKGQGVSTVEVNKVARRGNWSRRDLDRLVIDWRNVNRGNICGLVIDRRNVGRRGNVVGGDVGWWYIGWWDISRGNIRRRNNPVIIISIMIIVVVIFTRPILHRARPYNSVINWILPDNSMINRKGNHNSVVNGLLPDKSRALARAIVNDYYWSQAGAVVVGVTVVVISPV